jgi:hypothetical protein
MFRSVLILPLLVASLQAAMIQTSASMTGVVHGPTEQLSVTADGDSRTYETLVDGMTARGGVSATSQADFTHARATFGFGYMGEILNVSGHWGASVSDHFRLFGLNSGATLSVSYRYRCGGMFGYNGGTRVPEEENLLCSQGLKLKNITTSYAISDTGEVDFLFTPGLSWDDADVPFRAIWISDSIWGNVEATVDSFEVQQNGVRVDGYQYSTDSGAQYNFVGGSPIQQDASSVPEPATTALVGVGLLLLKSRRAYAAR